MGTSPGEPPASEPAGAQTQIAGQQTEPSTTVPHVPGAPLYRPSTAAPTNSLAVVSLVAGIMSFFAHIIPGVGGFTVAIVAIVTGYMARQQIKQSGEHGMWMATAGMIIGILHIALIAIVVLVLLFVVFVLGIALFGASRH